MSALLTIGPDRSDSNKVDGEKAAILEWKGYNVALIQIDEQDGEVNICIDTHPDAKFERGGFYPSLNRKRWFIKVKDADAKEEE
jgi:hypothetical protein